MYKLHCYFQLTKYMCEKMNSESQYVKHLVILCFITVLSNYLNLSCHKASFPLIISFVLKHMQENSSCVLYCIKRAYKRRTRKL